MDKRNINKRKLVRIEKAKKGRGYNVLFRCIECGKEKWIYKGNWDRGREGYYCSKECKIKAFKKIFKGKNNPNFRGGKIKVKCYQCGKELLRYSSQLKKNGKDIKSFCKKCLPDYLKNLLAEDTAHWQGGKRKSRGYILFHKSLVDEKYHYLLSNSKKSYIWEHRLVVAMKLDRKLRADEIIHHLNGIKDDNRPENLEIVNSKNHERHTFEKILQKRIRELEKKIKELEEK